jgi:hypothetical protein
MMNTINIIKRSFLAAAVVLTMGLATIQTASAGVTPNDAPIVQPLVGDGQETHGGKG